MELDWKKFNPTKLKTTANTITDKIGGEVKEKIHDLKGVPKSTLLFQQKNQMARIQKHWIKKKDPMYDGPEFEDAMRQEWDRAGHKMAIAGVTWEEFLEASREGIANPESYIGLSTIEKVVHKAVDKVGRNQPCPCGSGKKYKKCCGK